jgi:hypothetical protein
LNFRPNDFASIPLTSLAFPTPPPIQTIPPVAFNGQPLSLGSTQLVVSGAAQAVAFGPPATTPPVTIGGATSIVFAHVATGGPWSTEIALGNTSTAIQTLRIDFFGPDGLSTGSVTDIVIPARGVFFFSTDPQALQASVR